MLREYGVKNQSYQFLTSKYSMCYAEFSTTKNNKTEKKVPTGTTTKHSGHMNTCFL